MAKNTKQIKSQNFLLELGASIIVILIVWILALQIPNTIFIVILIVIVSLIFRFQLLGYMLRLIKKS